LAVSRTIFIPSMERSLGNVFFRKTTYRPFASSRANACPMSLTGGTRVWSVLLSIRSSMAASCSSESLNPLPEKILMPLSW